MLTCYPHTHISLQSRHKRLLKFSVVVFCLITCFCISNTWKSIFNSGVVVVHYLPLTTSLSTTNDKWIEKMEEKYRKSNERIRQVCQKYREKDITEFNIHNEYIERNIMLNMMVDVKHRLAYCRHGKVT